MLSKATYFEFDLENGQIIELMHAESYELRCTRGKIWLTEENASTDVVLSAGQRFHLTRPGRTLAQSIDSVEAAHCRLYPGAVAHGLEAMLSGWWQWFHAILSGSQRLPLTQGIDSKRHAASTPPAGNSRNAARPASAEHPCA